MNPEKFVSFLKDSGLSEKETDHVQEALSALTLGFTLGSMASFINGITEIDNGFYRVFKAFNESGNINSALMSKFIALYKAFDLIKSELQPSIFFKDDPPVDVSAAFVAPDAGS